MTLLDRLRDVFILIKFKSRKKRIFFVFFFAPVQSIVSSTDKKKEWVKLASVTRGDFPGQILLQLCRFLGPGIPKPLQGTTENSLFF